MAEKNTRSIKKTSNEKISQNEASSETKLTNKRTNLRFNELNIICLFVSFVFDTCGKNL